MIDTSLSKKFKIGYSFWFSFTLRFFSVWNFPYPWFNITPFNQMYYIVDQVCRKKY